MSKKSLVFFAMFLSGLVVLSSGCGPETQSANLSLEFDESVSTYKYTSEYIQDYKFEQPRLEKVKEEQNKTVVSMVYDREILSVEEDSSANAKIIIKELSVLMTGRDELDFDSTNENAKNQPLYDLIGKSYTIEIYPDGTVKTLNASGAQRAVSGGMSAKIARNLMSPEQIEKRHSVSLPEEQAAKIAKGESYSKVVPSPPKTLEPKAFEKIYTLDRIEDGIAVIEMSALPSDQPVEGMDEQAGLGFMAKMFDTQETYEGRMKFDIKKSQVLSLNEKFKATYFATDPNKDPEKSDKLKMGLTFNVSLEKL